MFGTAEYLLLDVADIGEAQMLVVTQILLSSWWGIFTLHCIYILSSTRLEKIATQDPLHKFDIWRKRKKFFRVYPILSFPERPGAFRNLRLRS